MEKYARFITSNAEIQTRITAAERDHASRYVGILSPVGETEGILLVKRHAKIRDQHLYLSVLQSLPESQAHLDDTPVFYPSMGESPFHLVGERKTTDMLHSNAARQVASCLRTCTERLPTRSFTRVSDWSVL